jgi:hypothetical protein
MLVLLASASVVLTTLADASILKVHSVDVHIVGSNNVHIY